MELFAGYIRVSTDDQTEYSPESQMKLLRERAKKDGGMIPDEYMFSDEGISGKDAAHRPAFSKMITLAKSKDAPFRRIYVWKYSRFARNQEESIVFKNLLRKNGVEVVSISEPVIEGAFGSLIERIIEWQDEYYLINLSGEVKRGMQEKASRGEAMCRTFGYDFVDQKRYIPNADSEIVKQIFSSFLAGCSMRAIARDLADSGFRTSRGNPPDNRFIQYVLNNPVYIGKIRWSKEGRAASKRHYDSDNIMLIDGTHKPIIDMDTWIGTQAKLKKLKELHRSSDRPENGRMWLLKGVAKCDCGGSLSFASVRSPSVQCCNYTHMHGCTVSHYISADKLTRSFIEGLKKCYALDQFVIDPKTDSPAALPQKNYEKLIAKEEQKLKRCAESYQAGYDTLEEYGKNKKEILAKIEAIKKEAASKQKQSDTHSAAAKSYKARTLNILNIIQDDSIPIEAKNLAVKTLLSRVVYKKPENSLVFYFK